MGRTSPHIARPQGHLPARLRAGDAVLPRRAGFTILELMILLVGLTVIASVGIPAYFGRPAVTLDGAANLLAKDLREVQNRAALYEEALWIRFDEDGNGYQITDGAGEPLLSPYGDGPFVRDYPFDAVFRGVSIVDVTPAKPGCVVFDRNGMPIDSVAVTIEYRGERREVVIRERSGLIAIDGDVVE